MWRHYKTRIYGSDLEMRFLPFRNYNYRFFTELTTIVQLCSTCLFVGVCKRELLFNPRHPLIFLVSFFLFSSLSLRSIKDGNRWAFSNSLELSGISDSFSHLLVTLLVLNDTNPSQTLSMSLRFFYSFNKNSFLNHRRNRGVCVST